MRAFASGLGRILLAASLGTSTLAFAGADGAGRRYEVRATLQPVQVSHDGRFGVRAALVQDPQRRSGDGRYALKGVGAGCGPLDGVFANGFE